MKIPLFSTLVSILVLSTASGVAAYTISIPPGSRLIANHLDNGGNTLDEVLPGVPNGTQISKYICTGYTNYTKVAAGWIPADGTLKPGEGAFIMNNSGAPFTVTFMGAPHVPMLPPPLLCGCGSDNLVSRQTTNSPSAFENIMGFPPVEGTRLYRWSGTGFTTYTFEFGAWDPSEPLVNLGESVLINVPFCPTAPFITVHPQSQMVPCQSNVTFSVNADGQPPLSYQWRFNNAAIGGETNQTLTRSNVTLAHAGIYSVGVSNSFGSVTSSNALLSIDTTPVSLTISQQGTNEVICWPLTCTDYRLEMKSPLNHSNTWSPVLATVFLVGSNCCVTNPIVEAKQFYRLHGQPPRILLQPVGETNVTNATVQLSVVVDGSPPFSYQWRLNGVSLLAETNSSLVISNLQLVNCGSYEVEVGNDVAATLSQPALVKLFGEEVVFSDAFGGYPATANTNGSLNGSNVGATKQAGEPAHAGKAGGKSVWFSWTPTQSGIATFDTIGSSFDTLLAVYTGTSVNILTNVVSDEDGAEFYRSTVKFNAVGGTKYEIAMDGFAGSSGNLVLNWSEEITSDTVPIILSQPQSQSVLPNTSATFSVVVESQPSLTNFYQWQFNGLAITNATGTNYTIPSVNRTNLNLGDYSVVVSNSFGRSVKSAVASLQTATAQAGSSTNAFLVDKLEELFEDSGTNGGHLRGSIKDPKRPDIEPNFVSVAAGTLITIVAGTGGLTSSSETMPCAKIVTGTLYVELVVGTSAKGKVMTIDTIGSTANTSLRLLVPTPLSLVCNDNYSTTVTYSQLTTTIPAGLTSAATYRATIGTVQGSSGTIQLNVTIPP